jgi:hypothetical protein
MILLLTKIVQTETNHQDNLSSTSFKDRCSKMTDLPKLPMFVMWGIKFLKSACFRYSNHLGL